jgi:hypothetical protein
VKVNVEGGMRGFQSSFNLDRAYVSQQ